MFRKGYNRLSIVTISLLFFIVGFLYSCSNAESPAQKNSASQTKATSTAVTGNSTTPTKENRQIVVYYFHGNARCPTCYKLENYAKSEIETTFADAIKSGVLSWKTVNIDKQEFAHYADKYKLYTKSVIVSTVMNGKETTWKNLDLIWQLVNDEQTYREYIKKEVEACLGGKCL